MDISSKILHYITNNIYQNGRHPMLYPIVSKPIAKKMWLITIIQLLLKTKTRLITQCKSCILWTKATSLWTLGCHKPSYPCSKFSHTSSLKLLKTNRSKGHAFTVCIHTENQNQVSFYLFVLHEISVLTELTLGHLRYHLTDMPPQPNAQPDSGFDTDRPAANRALILENEPWSSSPLNRISRKTIRVVVCKPIWTNKLIFFSLTVSINTKK